jgi:hypothetical protein
MKTTRCTDLSNLTIADLEWAIEIQLGIWKAYAAGSDMRREAHRELMRLEAARMA